MIATLTAFDANGEISHSDTQDYPDCSFLWEHIGAQQNNRRTVRVVVQTETGIEFDVQFSACTPTRGYSPSRRFHELLRSWGGRFACEPPHPSSATGG